MPKVSPSLCPYCGYFADAASSVTENEAPPKPGDISMCLSCGGVCVFSRDLMLRAITAEEREALPSHVTAFLKRMNQTRHLVVPSSGLLRDKGTS